MMSTRSSMSTVVVPFTSAGHTGGGGVQTRVSSRTPSNAPSTDVLLVELSLTVNRTRNWFVPPTILKVSETHAPVSVVVPLPSNCSVVQLVPPSLEVSTRNTSPLAVDEVRWNHRQ